MGINSEMKKVKLQVKEYTESLAGADKPIWKDVKEPSLVAIYKTNDTLNTQSIRYNASSHTGLTFSKDIKEGINRLVENNVVYEVTSANPKGRLNSLLLKVVDTNV
ncbi:hypothetical protein H7E67_02220 [Clostridium gasigenes]|uniref:hypothetical protein n=1 Tax=Clostridium gasigenes TaxID=94869 RepID=UPI001624CC48|nr:hypothetical protein [Clostridium gasigenes]MBB6622237.1 hypothetical protein [Clostridium gasigenes]